MKHKTKRRKEEFLSVIDVGIRCTLCNRQLDEESINLCDHCRVIYRNRTTEFLFAMIRLKEIEDAEGS